MRVLCAAALLATGPARVVPIAPSLALPDRALTGPAGDRVIGRLEAAAQKALHTGEPARVAAWTLGAQSLYPAPLRRWKAESGAESPGWALESLEAELARLNDLGPKVDAQGRPASPLRLPQTYVLEDDGGFSQAEVGGRLKALDLPDLREVGALHHRGRVAVTAEVARYPKTTARLLAAMLFHEAMASRGYPHAETARWLESLTGMSDAALQRHVADARLWGLSGSEAPELGFDPRTLSMALHPFTRPRPSGSHEVFFDAEGARKVSLGVEYSDDPSERPSLRFGWLDPDGARVVVLLLPRSEESPEGLADDEGIMDAEVFAAYLLPEFDRAVDDLLADPAVQAAPEVVKTYGAFTAALRAMLGR
ncbi:MAG: hypothetical protein HYZ75_18775 [Elusimicrobia bacterium]|nr:hypothetical protein [Elusimicrobiota bacterium]